jgi:hypothetical protein
MARATAGLPLVVKSRYDFSAKKNRTGAGQQRCAVRGRRSVLWILRWIAIALGPLDFKARMRIKSIKKVDADALADG